MSIAGLNQLGSSKLAGVIIIRPGMPSPRPVTGEPQFGQKPRLSVLPLSALTVWYLTSPVSFSVASGTASTEEEAPPPARWQSRQWHVPVKTGSAELS